MSNSHCCFAAVQSGHCQNQENNCSEDVVSTTTTPEHGNMISMLHSLVTEIVSACGKKICVLFALISILNMLHFYAWNWFCFKKTSLVNMQISVPQTIVSFHNSSQTRQQLWEGVYKVIFVMLLKKCLKIMWEALTEGIWETQHYTSQSSASSQNLMFHFSS